MTRYKYKHQTSWHYSHEKVAEFNWHIRHVLQYSKKSYTLGGSSQLPKQLFLSRGIPTTSETVRRPVKTLSIWCQTDRLVGLERCLFMLGSNIKVQTGDCMPWYLKFCERQDLFVLQWRLRKEKQLSRNKTTFYESEQSIGEPGNVLRKRKITRPTKHKSLEILKANSNCEYKIENVGGGILKRRIKTAPGGLAETLEIDSLIF